MSDKKEQLKISKKKKKVNFQLVITVPNQEEKIIGHVGKGETFSEAVENVMEDYESIRIPFMEGVARYMTTNKIPYSALSEYLDLAEKERIRMMNAEKKTKKFVQQDLFAD